MIPEVFIASVPWRQKNLEALLLRLPPVRTTVLLDGYTERPAAPAHVELLDVPWGAGARWRLASTRVDSLAIVLDDDFLVDYPYVERCVAAWERIQAPFAWAGFNRQGIYVKFDKITTVDTALTVLAGGHAVVPTALLAGLEADPDANEYLGPNGHDEAFISYYLRRQGVPLMRPAGRSGLNETPLHYDSRAQWRRDPAKYERHRKVLERRVIVDQMAAGKVDAAEATRVLRGADVVYYAGDRPGKIIEVREDGCVRVVWAGDRTPFDAWYPLGREHSSVRFA